MHDTTFGVELLRRDEFVNRPLDVAFYFRVNGFVFKFSKAGGFPGFKFDIFHAGEFLMPFVDLADEFVDAATFHAEAGMQWRSVDFCAIGLRYALGCVFLIANVVDNRVDVAPVEVELPRFGGVFRAWASSPCLMLFFICHR